MGYDSNLMMGQPQTLQGDPQINSGFTHQQQFGYGGGTMPMGMNQPGFLGIPTLQGGDKFMHFREMP